MHLETTRYTPTTEEALETVRAERAFLIELCAELRRENERLRAALIGVPEEELPY
jgi:hypothetical protein